MKPHPYAELFPILSDDELAEMAADIKKHGLRHAVVLLDGKILDGRNRFRACQLARVNATFTQYKGTDPLGFVLSENLHRRHLTTSQRAEVAARLANHGSGKPTQICVGMASEAKPVLTNSEAAKALNVSEHSVQNAKKMLAVATPKEVAEVKAGTKTVTAVLKAHPKPAASVQGQQKIDPRLFVRLLDDMGGILRKIDSLHKAAPSAAHHESALNSVKDAMATVDSWRKVSR